MFADVFSEPVPSLQQFFFFFRQIFEFLYFFWMFVSYETPHGAPVEACLGARFLLCLRTPAPMISPHADHGGVYFFGGDGELCP